MATYSLAQAVSGNQDHICTDGTNIYVLTRGVGGNAYKVYKYTPPATLTDISAATFAANPALGSTTQIECFDGGVYVLLPSNATTMAVYKWDGGVATTWTLVDSAAVAVGDIVNSRQYMVADSNRIAWNCFEQVISGTYIFRAS